MKNGFKVSYHSIYMLLFCVFMVRPYYIQISPLNRIWSGMTLLFSIISFMVLFKYNRLKDSLPCVLVGVLYVVSTALNERGNTPGAVSTFDQFALAYNAGLITCCPGYNHKSLKVINWVVTMYLYIDIVCGFLDVGQYLGELDLSATFFAYDNYALYYILPMLAVKWAISCWENHELQKRDWMCWGLCVLYKVKTMSLNAIAALFIFAFLYLVFKYFKKAQRIINPKSAAATVVLLLIGVHYFKIHNFFAELIFALGRGTTLGYRTVIWEKTIPLLHNTPLWGYGKLSQGSFQTLVGFSPVFDLEANHPHNLILQIWFDMGLLGIAVYTNLIHKSIQAINFLKAPVKNVCSCGIIAFFMAGFLDGYPYITTFYLMLSLIRRIGAIPNEKKKHEQQD